VEALNHCGDSYLRFVLRNAPVVVSHQVRTHKLFKPLSEFNSKSIILQPISIAHLLTCSFNSISNWILLEHIHFKHLLAYLVNSISNWIFFATHFKHLPQWIQSNWILFATCFKCSLQWI
jgi:hypothetical protein